jgi:UDP-N-acetylglucosamine 2-epimerase (non-hydrolysing)
LIWFCLGTAAELIKVYPVIRLAQERGAPWFALSTGQSGRSYRAQWDDFRLPRERAGAVLPTDVDLGAAGAAARWMVWALAQGRGALRRRIGELAGVLPVPGQDTWVVHGDTLSTVVGSRWAKALGVRLAHLEAGLSSGTVREPFPEELSRRWVSRRADLLFPPDETAAANLRHWGVRGRVHLTHGNTLLDAVLTTLEQVPAPEQLPEGPFALANIHRFENLSSPERFRRIVEILEETASRLPLYLVQHRQTEETFARHPALRARLEARGARLLARMPFTRFIHWVERAEFLVTDGGSNQEECSYLGLPCLILRKSTERREGLGESCVLNGLDLEGARRFLEAPARYRRARVSPQLRPSEVVLREVTHG